MKKLFFLLAFALSVASNAFAEEVQIDGLWYNLSRTTAKVIHYKNDVKYSGDIVIPIIVSYNNTDYNVTSIGDGAFKDCSGLTSVTIGNGVTSIGKNAFYGCSGLESITIGNSVTSIDFMAFSGCNNIRYVELHCPQTPGWLSGKSTVEKLIIGDEVTSITESAFANCSGLTSVTIGNGV